MECTRIPEKAVAGNDGSVNTATCGPLSSLESHTFLMQHQAKFVKSIFVMPNIQVMEVSPVPVTPRAGVLGLLGLIAFVWSEELE